MSLTALARVPLLSVRTHWLWLQGTLILENPRDLVIPACQSRALWAGVTTGYAEPRVSKIVMVEPGSSRVQKNAAQAAHGGVLSQKSWQFCLTFLLVLLPTSLIAHQTILSKIPNRYRNSCQVLGKIWVNRQAGRVLSGLRLRNSRLNRSGLTQD